MNAELHHAWQRFRDDDAFVLVINVGRTFEEQLRQEADSCYSMFARRDSQAIGASAFKQGRTPEWPHHGL